MGRKVLLLLLIVLLATPVMSTNVYYSSLFVDPFSMLNSVLSQVEFKFTNFFDTLEYNIEPIEIEAPIVEMMRELRFEVEILELSFYPKVLNVSIGDEVTWINKREKLDAFVIGLREINGMKSPFMHPADEYSWTFDEVGKFTYSDGVVIGLTGQVIVE
jgi:plastocyanin